MGFETTGLLLGDFVGDLEGGNVGEGDGTATDGEKVGVVDGPLLGVSVTGFADGDNEGAVVGICVGRTG